MMRFNVSGMVSGMKAKVKAKREARFKKEVASLGNLRKARLKAEGEAKVLVARDREKARIKKAKSTARKSRHANSYFGKAQAGLKKANKKIKAHQKKKGKAPKVKSALSMGGGESRSAGDSEGARKLFG